MWRSGNYHGWPKIDDDIFKQLKWIPTPTPSLSSDKYKNFEDIYGNELTDEHCPSILNRGKNNENIQKAGFALMKSNARLIKVCALCQFPRLLYAKKQISVAQEVKAEQLFEKNGYYCGMNLDSLPFLFQHQKTVCYAAINLQYYQVKLEGYRPMCHKYLATENLLPDKSVPECENCLTKSQPKTKNVYKKNLVGRPKKINEL